MTRLKGVRVAEAEGWAGEFLLVAVRGTSAGAQVRDLVTQSGLTREDDDSFNVSSCSISSLRRPFMKLRDERSWCNPVCEPK